MLILYLHVEFKGSDRFSEARVVDNCELPKTGAGIMLSN